MFYMFQLALEYPSPIVILVVADCSDPCPRKSHGVQTNTVEKADAGTLDWCLGNWGYPLYGKWQLSESMLHSCIYQWKIRSSRSSGVPQAWCHVFCIPLCLNEKGLRPIFLSYFSYLVIGTLSDPKVFGYVTSYCSLTVRCTSVCIWHSLWYILLKF